MSIDSIKMVTPEKPTLAGGQPERLAELSDMGESVRSNATETIQTEEHREFLITLEARFAKMDKLDKRPEGVAFARVKKELEADPARLSDLVNIEKRCEAIQAEENREFLVTLQARFTEQPEHYKRCEGVDFVEVKKALEADPALLTSLTKLEGYDAKVDIIDVEPDAFIFADCRANFDGGSSYDSADYRAKKYGVEMMTKETYLAIQKTGKFDTASSWSWLATPRNFRRWHDGDAFIGTRLDEKAGVTQANDYCNGGLRFVLRVPKA